MLAAHPQGAARRAPQSRPALRAAGPRAQAHSTDQAETAEVVRLAHGGVDVTIPPAAGGAPVFAREFVWTEIARGAGVPARRGRPGTVFGAGPER